MNWQTFLTDAGVVVAIIGLIGLLAKALIDFHASRPAAEKISVETFADVTKELDRLEKKVIALRDDNEKLHEDNDALHKRIDALEEQLEIKNSEIKRKQDDIEVLKQQFNELKSFVRNLLQELDAKGVEYTKPPKRLLDTDPSIPAVIKKVSK